MKAGSEAVQFLPKKFPIEVAPDDRDVRGRLSQAPGGPDVREHIGTPPVRDDRFAAPPQPASRGRRTGRPRGQDQNLSRRKAVWVALVLVPTVVAGLALARAAGPG